MRSDLSISTVLAAALCLTACASQPKIALTHTPAAIAPASFRLSQAGAVEQMVAERLKALGYSEAPAGAAAVYRVDGAYAVRSVEVGALVPGDTAANAPKAVLAQPAKARRWPWRERQAHTLVVDISEASTGKPVYSVRASTLATSAQAEGLMARLAAAALVSLPLPAQKTP